MRLETAAAAPDASPITCDVVVVGAGPVGLFQVFELGLQGISAHVVDALPHVGGQCVELYGDKAIYDIPGIKACTGQELADRLHAQAAPFEPVYHLGQQVEQLQRQGDGRLLLQTTAGTQFSAAAVVLACGVGAFVPRLLKLDGAKALAGTQLHYHPSQLHIAQGQQVVVLGGDEAAIEAAIQCATRHEAATVTLVHRRDVFTGPEALLDQFQQLRDAQRIQVVIGQPAQLHCDSTGALLALEISTPEGAQQQIPTGLVLAYLGISPKLGPIADWGLEMACKQVAINMVTFSTSESGIYAVGDLIAYPGKRKLILCGFHEATLAAFAVAEQLQGQPPLLQYTSSSSHLHSLLGVDATQP